MTTQFADRSAPRRGRRVAIVTSVLAAAVAPIGAGAATSVARAATPHAGQTYRVLNIVVASSRTHDSTNALQYITPRDRYQLVRSYTGKRYDGASSYWQRDILGGKQRSVKRVVVESAQKMVLVQTRTVPPLPPAHLGIRSTIKVVRQAIQDGKATPQGLTRKDGQRVRLLVLNPNGPKVFRNLLWVDSSTDQPVAASKAYHVGGGGVVSKKSHWENLKRSALDEVTDQPKFPAGYAVSHERNR